MLLDVAKGVICSRINGCKTEQELESLLVELVKVTNNACDGLIEYDQHLDEYYLSADIDYDSPLVADMYGAKKAKPVKVIIVN